MPFVKQKSSKGLQPSYDARSIFIGRNDELLFFVQNILRAEDPAHNIISISGQGGVGKSTLMTHFIQMAYSIEFKENCLVALVDEHQTTPASIMEKFADQLHITGEFEKALKLYKDALRKLQTEQDSVRDNLANKIATDLTGTIVKEVPGVGSFLEKEAGTAIGYLIGEIRYRQHLKDVERLEDPIANLTKAFVTELNMLSATMPERQRRVILFFDTFEQLAPEATPWLLDHLLQASISTNVVLVIAGRDPIERSTSANSKRWLPYYDNSTIYPISLESFTKAETSVYLIARGITAPDQISTIWQLSQGLPLYLSLLTSNPQGKVDPTTDVVANFLRWIPESEQVKRRLALDAALLSKPFNQDDMDAFKYLSGEDQFELYQWLITLPFVRSIPQDGRYNYHKLAQQLFCRHLYQRSQREYQNTRRALADYYQKLLEKTQKEAGIEIYGTAKWLEVVQALIYQLLSLPDEDSHIQAIEQVIRTCKHANQTGEIVKIIHELSEEQPNSITSLSARQIAKQLLCYIEADSESQPQESLEITSDLLEKLNNVPSFSPEVLAGIYLKRASTYITLDEYEHAIQDLNRAIALNPKDDSAYVLRGNAYIQIKEYKKSLIDYDRVLTLNPDDAKTYAIRAQVYLHLKEYEQAIQDINQALEVDPKFPHPYLLRSIVYSLNKEYQLALQDLDQAIKLEPEFALAYFMRSQVYSLLKKQEQALKDLNKMMEEFLSVLGNTPKLALAYALQGQAYNSLNKHRLAIKSLDQALELDPNLALAYAIRGLVYCSYNKYHQAIEDLNRALELDPKLTDILAVRGNAFSNLKEYQSAIHDLDQALELNPNNAFAYTFRARIYMELKEYEQAIQDFTRAIELTAKDPQAYTARGRAYFYLKEYERAIQDFTRVVELTPKDAQAYTARGHAYFYLKEYERAIQDLNRAVTVNPKFAEAYTVRGLIYAYSEKTGQSLKDLHRALELDPQNAMAYAARSIVFSTQEEYQKAIEDVNQAFELDPQNAMAYAARSQIYIGRKEYHMAVADLDRVIEDNPMDSSAYYSRGLAYLWLKDIRSAQNNFIKCWELDPTEPIFGWAAEWANMCLESNDTKRVERLKKIAEIKPHIQMAYLCRGVALWLSEQYEEARVVLELACSLRPELGGAQFWRGMAYASLGRDAEALESLEKSTMVKLSVPPVLLVLLDLLKQKRSDFYEKYGLPFLTRHL